MDDDEAPHRYFVQDKFQKCCGERKLYFRGDCYSPLQRGPCEEGQWLIMEKGNEEGVCKKMPCESPIQVDNLGGIEF